MRIGLSALALTCTPSASLTLVGVRITALAPSASLITLQEKTTALLRGLANDCVMAQDLVPPFSTQVTTHFSKVFSTRVCAVAGVSDAAAASAPKILKAIALIIVSLHHVCRHP